VGEGETGERVKILVWAVDQRNQSKMGESGSSKRMWRSWGSSRFGWADRDQKIVKYSIQV